MCEIQPSFLTGCCGILKQRRGQNVNLRFQSQGLACRIHWVADNCYLGLQGGSYEKEICSHGHRQRIVWRGSGSISSRLSADIHGRGSEWPTRAARASRAAWAAWAAWATRAARTIRGATRAAVRTAARLRGYDLPTGWAPG